MLPLAKSISEGGIYSSKKGSFDRKDYFWVLNSDKFFGFKLPGNGEAYGEDEVSGACGDILTHKTVGCLEVEKHNQVSLDFDASGKAVIKLFARTCFRPECPICYEKWAGRLAGKAEHRILNYIEKHTYRSASIHVTVSIPVKDWGLVENNYEKLRRIVYNVVKQAGLRGGCAIFHPYRSACYNCGTNKNPGDLQCPNCGSRDFRWYFSPHFHFVGIGWITGVGGIYKKTGYVVVNLGVRSSVSATVLYQLSHCGINDNHHSMTWFGCMAYSKYKSPPEKRKDDVCPICGSVLRPVLWDSSKIMNLELPYKTGINYVPVEAWVYTDRYRCYGYG